MRKNSMVFITLVLLSLLLAGCVGGGTGAINPNPPVGPNPPITTEPDAIFDGSPTHLSLVFERNAPAISTLSLNSLANSEMAFVHITRKEGHDVVYSVLKKVVLESSTPTFSIENEVPAGQGYETRAIILRETELVEVGSMNKINAPANSITSLSVPMTAPVYSLTLPDNMYSGGAITQIKTGVPEDHKDLSYVYVWVGLNPWQKNGAGLWSANNENEGWIVGAVHGSLPEVTKPTKLYYQVGVGPRGDLFPRDEMPWPYYYEPNVEAGEELPYIWIYPYPGWEE